jgi:hypothetical protein
MHRVLCTVYYIICYNRLARIFGSLCCYCSTGCINVCILSHEYACEFQKKPKAVNRRFPCCLVLDFTSKVTYQWQVVTAITVAPVRLVRSMVYLLSHIFLLFSLYDVLRGRSQWPCGLWHELSSVDRTLRSWVRISPKAWMSVCVVLCR